MRFDLTDLRLFLCIVEAGSITRGAEMANLALPSASGRLRGMEEVAGVTLLERGRRGVSPTPAGSALAHHARLVLAQIDRMRGELGEFAGGMRGRVRILANTAAMTEFLPEVLAPWLAAHPKIDIDLRERQSTDIVAAISGGHADIGIVSDAVDHGGLKTLPFAVDRMVVVAPPDSPLAGRRQIAFTETLDHGFVGLGAGSALQDYLGGHAARAGRRIAFRIRMRGFDGLCRMVAAGVGIGIVPETAAARGRRLWDIATIPLSDGWAARRLLLCLRDPGALAPPARALVQALTA
ncbi:MAG: LysR family transcriptional regulator [Alphaproteobacteria bacterium]|jgi:DNA-binding transcriptional LysR family regulator|nr:LysR family transcriptional regulator [Alphaproteobacteria bacterium]